MKRFSKKRFQEIKEWVEWVVREPSDHRLQFSPVGCWLDREEFYYTIIRAEGVTPRPMGDYVVGIEIYQQSDFPAPSIEEIQQEYPEVFEMYLWIVQTIREHGFDVFINWDTGVPLETIRFAATSW